jgi:hypothetical protein
MLWTKYTVVRSKTTGGAGSADTRKARNRAKKHVSKSACFYFRDILTNVKRGGAKNGLLPGYI